MLISARCINITKPFIFFFGIGLYLYFTSKLLKPKRLVKSDVSELEEKKNRLLVVTRVHMKSALSMPDPAKVIQFIENCKSYADGILVCVGAEEYSVITSYIDQLKLILLNSTNLSNLGRVTFIPVYPWGYFTTALNAALQFAQDQHFDRIAYQSIEFRISQREVRKVMFQLNKKDIIVAGPEMDGHEFIEGNQYLTGRRCPWNTFAIWKVAPLALLGFPLVGDGNAADRSIGGVEELSTISLLQHINPNYQAVLLRVKKINYQIPPSMVNDKEGVRENDDLLQHSWDTTFSDPQRQLYHKRKMESKNSRPAQQMKLLGSHVLIGRVLHIVDDVGK